MQRRLLAIRSTRWRIPGRNTNRLHHRCAKISTGPNYSTRTGDDMGGDSVGLQGVTELIPCERCNDPWLLSVQAEIRDGNMSKHNYDFLHGRPTLVPGSWLQNDVECGNPRCKGLVTVARNRIGKGERVLGEWIKARECQVCSEARKSKALVAQSVSDTRFASQTL